MAMPIKFDGEKPIFIQVAERIEDAILAGAFPEESQVPSITEISVNYRINPATALKGINMLVDRGIIYKRRGLGMFVLEGAQETLRQDRRELFYHNFIENMIAEAKKLCITQGELSSMIERGFTR